MNKVILLFLLSFLFQSCFSYKSVNFNDIKNEKKQKIIIETIYKENIKGKLIYIDEKQITLKKSGELKSFSKEEIRNVSVRKFSISKTAEVAIDTYVNSKKN